MMRNMIAGLLALSLFASCQRFSSEELPQLERTITIAPPEGENTRTALSNLTPQWCEGDCIWLSNGDKSVSITLAGEDILPDGKCRISVTDMPGKLYALYPASSFVGFSDGSIEFAFPSNPDGSFASAHISASVIEDGQDDARFRNLGSVLRILIDPDMASNVDKVEIVCDGICGRYVTSAEDITALSASSPEGRVEVSTSGGSECYVGVPPMTIPSSTTFIFKDKQQNVLYTRTSTKDNVISRNVLMDLSFLRQSIKLVQQSILDPSWHKGDEITLTDGLNTEQYVIKDSDIASDGSVTLSTQLLVKDHIIRAVCPSSRFAGNETDGSLLIDIPECQDGTLESADITYAECLGGVLSFKTAVPVIKMTALPGAAGKLRFDAKYVTCSQMMSSVTKPVLDLNHSSLSLDLNHRGLSVYYVAVSAAASAGTIHYLDDNGTSIGSNSVTFQSSASAVWNYGPLREVASIDLGESWSNWLGYYPDDAMIGDLIMPGTHDAGTYGYSGLLSGQVKCQDIDFASQLKKGVRCFDLRLSENMNIFHGSFYCSKSLSDFLDACISFLKSHPREAVFCFVKSENSEGEEKLWNEHFQEKVDAYGRSNFVIDKELASYELSRLRGKIVVITRDCAVDSFGYIEGAPQIHWIDDSWTTCTSGADIQIALEDNYTAEKGSPKKNKILDFLKAVSDEGGYMVDGHRTRWIVTYTSGYNGYTFGIPWPEDFCEELLKSDIIKSLEDGYDTLVCDGMIFFHDFIEKWDDYTDHLFNDFVRKK